MEPATKILAQNRKARHEYHVLEELEVGVALRGTEVKVLRQGQGSIAEAHCRILGDELFLIGAHIPEYAQGNVHNHVPLRDRKLLAHRREIAKWQKKVKERGVTIVPLALYLKGSVVKLLIGLVRGKKLYDKRAAQRDKDDKRDMERAARRRR